VTNVVLAPIPPHRPDHVAWLAREIVEPVLEALEPADRAG
jgi:hypothetical protein